MTWDEVNLALALEGIELWPGEILQHHGETDVFCRPCLETLGNAPLALLTTISLALEHVQSESHRERRTR